jgi:hypothetical protein
MAHYALLDENNIVVNVITGVDENIIQTDLDGTLVGGTSEAWEQFYASLPWFEGLICKRTSYNAKITGFRKNYAVIGGIYDESLDAFISPKPFESWVLNEQTCRWVSPVEIPGYDKMYIWNEEDLRWDETN